MVIFTYIEAYLPPTIALLDLVEIPQTYFMFWKLPAVCLPQILIFYHLIKFLLKFEGELKKLLSAYHVSKKKDHMLCQNLSYIDFEL